MLKKESVKQIPQNSALSPVRNRAGAPRGPADEPDKTGRKTTGRSGVPALPAFHCNSRKSAFVRLSEPSAQANSRVNTGASSAQKKEAHRDCGKTGNLPEKFAKRLSRLEKKAGNVVAEHRQHSENLDGVPAEYACPHTVFPPLLPRFPGNRKTAGNCAFPAGKRCIFIPRPFGSSGWCGF